MSDVTLFRIETLMKPNETLFSVKYYCKKGCFMVGFGERLKKARNDNHLTQVQLAKRLSIDRVTLTNYESDVRFPPIETLIKISKELHVTMEYLLDLPSGQETVDVSGLAPNEIEMIRMMVYMFRASREEKNK